jgi:hypothetical protein
LVLVVLVALVCHLKETALMAAIQYLALLHLLVAVLGLKLV